MVELNDGGQAKSGGNFVSVLGGGRINGLKLNGFRSTADFFALDFPPSRDRRDFVCDLSIEKLVNVGATIAGV